MLKKLINFVTNSSCRFEVLDRRGFYNSMDDEKYLKKKFKAIMGKDLNLENPKTFNEKLQWLKLYNRKDEYTIMVDKVAVRDYISEKLGEEYLIPCLGVWDDPDDIDFDKLPDKFVLKCNHNSGLGMCICRDKSKLDIEKVKNELKKGLTQDYFLVGREWPYKDVTPRIIAEKYMSDGSEHDIKDYKFMCFDGVVHNCFVCSERQKGLKVTFFDLNWEVLPFTRHYPKSDEHIEKPKNFEKMIELAKILSKGLPFVRVDFYEIEGKIFFGELTFFPGCGLEEFTPEEWDYRLGELIKLPKK